MMQENIELKKYSNFKIGGLARYFLKSDNVDDLILDLKNWRQSHRDEKFFVLGGGTNILFDDRGFDGLVIRPQFNHISKIDNDALEVGAGTLISDLLKHCIDNSLSGLEWAGGLPGTIGGAIFGNAGAFGGETKDSVISVKSLNINTFKVSMRTCLPARQANTECQFGYRQSIFKNELQGEEIIISAILKFDNGDSVQIKKIIDEKIAYREQRQPLEFPNLGSTFKNPKVDDIPQNIQNKYRDKIKNDPFPVIPAAVFLSVAGLKGEKIGGAQISEKHPNFIVNCGGAKSSDVKELIKLAQDTVKQKFAIDLVPEIIELEY